MAPEAPSLRRLLQTTSGKSVQQNNNKMQINRIYLNPGTNYSDHKGFKKFYCKKNHMQMYPN